jgi:hypothetical protein
MYSCIIVPIRGGSCSYRSTVQQFICGAWQVVRLVHESSIAILSFVGSCLRMTLKGLIFEWQKGLVIHVLHLEPRDCVEGPHEGITSLVSHISACNLGASK